MTAPPIPPRPKRRRRSHLNDRPGPEPSRTQPSNILLEVMGEAARTRLLEAAEMVRFVHRQAVSIPLGAKGLVLFPEFGLIAIQSTNPEATPSEVGAVGRDGAIGLLDALSGQVAPFRHLTLTAASAWGVASGVVREVVRTDPVAAAAAWRYVARIHDEARNELGCAMRHGGRARLADHLLSAWRAGGGAPVAGTQDEMAVALGMTRTTAHALLTEMSEQGLLITRRGRIEVQAPTGLAKIGCGCWSGRSLGPPGCRDTPTSEG